MNKVKKTEKESALIQMDQVMTEIGLMVISMDMENLDTQREPYLREIGLMIAWKDQESSI